MLEPNLHPRPFFTYGKVHLILMVEFYTNAFVAGACGEIYVDTGVFSNKLFNPLVAAQNFEYKMSNILNKPFESTIGFIAVLPGAFSAYRYSALQNGEDGEGPLAKYFLGETMNTGTNLLQANMYLAEDRVLCFELVTKRDQAWLLRYVRVFFFIEPRKRKQRRMCLTVYPNTFLRDEGIFEPDLDG